MTEQEAIEVIKYASAFNSDNSPLTKALNVAIEALERQMRIKEILSTPTLFAEKFDRIREIEKIMLN